MFPLKKMGSFPPLCPPLAIYNLTGVLFLEKLFKRSVNTIQNNPDNTDVKNRLLGIFKLKGTFSLLSSCKLFTVQAKKKKKKSS